MSQEKIKTTKDHPVESENHGLEKPDFFPGKHVTQDRRREYSHLIDEDTAIKMIMSPDSMIEGFKHNVDASSDTWDRKWKPKTASVMGEINKDGLTYPLNIEVTYPGFIGRALRRRKQKGIADFTEATIPKELHND
jgi:hypothetical protein